MHTFTARLPLVDWDGDTIPRLIGDSTENSMRSGALRGAASEIEGTIALYRQDFEDLQVLLNLGFFRVVELALHARQRLRLSLLRDLTLEPFVLNALL